MSGGDCLVAGQFFGDLIYFVFVGIARLAIKELFVLI
jgi:hypothetical protein